MASMPLRDTAGAGSLRSCVQTPGLPGLSQDCPGGHEGSAQQVLSTQFPEMQSLGSSHAPPFGACVAVGVTVRVPVDVRVDVAVRVTVAVLVWVPVAVWVDVCVTVAVAVAVGVLVTVAVAVAVAVRVDCGLQNPLLF